MSALLDPADLTEGFGKLGASASFAQVSGSGLIAVIGAARAITADAPSLLLPLAEPGWRVVLFVLGYGVSAFACSLFSASQVAYRQSVCPPELRGRMNGASRWVIWGTLPAGGLLAGTLGALIGIRPSIWIAYVGSWAVGFLVFFSPLRRVRDVPDLVAGEARRPPDR